jgi:hypothetical protein
MEVQMITNCAGPTKPAPEMGNGDTGTSAVIEVRWLTVSFRRLVSPLPETVKTFATAVGS